MFLDIFSRVFVASLEPIYIPGIDFWTKIFVFFKYPGNIDHGLTQTGFMFLDFFCRVFVACLEPMYIRKIDFPTKMFVFLK